MDVLLVDLLASRQNQAIHGYEMQLSPYQVRDNVPMVALYGLVSRPLPGARAVVLCQDGDPSKAVCVGVNDPRYNLVGLEDGVVGLAHYLGASILFYADRIEIQGNGAPITIANAGQVTITTSSKVRIEGDLQVTGEVTARADGGAVQLSQHVHTGVTRGAGSTDLPNG